MLQDICAAWAMSAYQEAASQSEPFGEVRTFDDFYRSVSEFGEFLFWPWSCMAAMRKKMRQKGLGR
jgi:hypothetical protein